ncbi:hypothetical protein M406DRAFT_67503 [Cryphonectria parasitica EP155]|uniref:Phospholipase/carboxylesterase/thioesterase domain-containing protein n=1 Tax=Cryphonectria parasitica (strain ATCC 38755 / EP155) TaxID=660469 RepID=A0A9P4YD54_CRYP1|nr:uncharacterized protein M406DRAFT_67503 [Cryphonectria parasitica EP155]KAF3771178.1 hypothetical protein M406DRAFT_67503 [Cryphonectria parasitica EP155]
MALEDIFPEPLVLAPLSGTHRHTIILLHGRGSRADAFSTEVSGTHLNKLPNFADDLDHNAAPSTTPPSPTARKDPTTLQEALPDAKFIFPWARKQRATVYKRSIIRQWFDDWHCSPELSGDIVDTRYDKGLQTPGLGDTVRFLHGLIAAEARILGSARNVVLGGFSQGAAASLVAALLWDDGGEGLGAVVSMAGRLPYQTQIMAHLDTAACAGNGSSEVGDDYDVVFDPFEDPATLQDGETRAGPTLSAIEWLREEIELPKEGRSILRHAQSTTSVLLCHGQDDQQVYIEGSRRALEILPRLGLRPVVWRTYDGVGHALSDDMLSDVAGFLRGALGLS